MDSALTTISKKLAGEKSFTGDAEKDAEILAYGMKILLLNATALGGIILLAWPLGILKTTLLIWAAAYSLRVFAGGRHSSGPVSCWLVTVSVFITLGYLVEHFMAYINEYMLLFTALGLVFSLYAVISYAPVTISSKQFNPTKRRHLKMISVAVIILWATVALNPQQIILNDLHIPVAITVGLAVQSLNIVPLTGLSGFVQRKQG